MQDTSGQNTNRWKTIGAKRSLDVPNSLGQKSLPRRFCPIKDNRQVSNSKIFDRNKSRLQSSQDNINRYQSNQLNLSGHNASKDNLRDKSKSSRKSAQFGSVLKKQTIDNSIKDIASPYHDPNQKSNIWQIQNKQFTAFKEDYQKFKQKIVADLEIQKLNISKMVQQIISFVNQQIADIQKKYNSIPSDINKQDQNSNNLLLAFNQIPTFKGLNLNQMKLTKQNLTKQNVSSPKQRIKSLKQCITSTNPKSQFQKPQSSQNVSKQPIRSTIQPQDPQQVTQKFSKFYSAIEKLKKDLDCLHEISTVNHMVSPMMSPMNSPVHRNTSKSSFVSL